MCPLCKSLDFRKNGFFQKNNGRTKQIQRHFCRSCKKSFSKMTFSPFRGERKSHVNQKIFRLLSSGVSQRETARLVGVHHITVARKLIRLSRSIQQQSRQNSKIQQSGEIIFDEMESFEHSKCKPLSIAVAVNGRTRSIISIKVASMPAKGHLSKISLKRYGYRRDDRPKAINDVLSEVGQRFKNVETVTSDESPRYPIQMKKHFPSATHTTYKGRRGCIVGQGELKRGGFDPLFSLNHTCALIRDRVKCMSRRTWCTTKCPERLEDRLLLYMWRHNQEINGRKRLTRV